MFKKSLIGLMVVAATQLTACGSSDSKDAPTDIILSNTTVAENAVAVNVGTLSVVDADSDNIATFTIDHPSFVISGNTLQLADGVTFDYETEQSLDINITATDADNLSFTKSFTIEITDVLDVYAFTNTLSNDNSVSYSGQTARHVLIAELNNYINSGLQTDIDDGTVTTSAEAYAKLLSYYEMNADEYAIYGDRALTISTIGERAENTLIEISGSLKDLSGKIAGNDATGQHKDWNTEFEGFGSKGNYSPEGLIKFFFEKIAANAEQAALGNLRFDYNGDVITKVYLGEDGLDYKQLIQKTLLGAVAYSQGTDDYLDANVEDKGLLTSNVELVDGKTYTNLEHQFDEGFGYFGAARDYLSYTDSEIAAKGGREEYQGMFDADSSGSIDLVSEYNFGHSQNAAKRDLGTADNTNPTDFTENAMQAFLEARKLIADNVGAELSDAQMETLLTYRDQAVLNWELSIAATAVHYINDVRADYQAFGTDEFNYSDLAKHWSELKGFVISLQFNPNKQLTDAQFTELNSLIKDAPVLTGDDAEAAVNAYLADLLTARGILQQAYEFNDENTANW